MIRVARLWDLEALDTLPRGVARRLVNILYSQVGALTLGTVAMVAVGILAFLRTGSGWFLLWAGLTAILATGRLLLHRAYRRRAVHDNPRRWAQHFLAWSWATGALWGSAGIAVALVPDPYVHLLIVAVQTGYVMGGAVRVTALPKVAIGQTLLVLMPTLTACLFAADPFVRCFALFVALFIGISISITRSLCAMTMRLLLADEEKSRQIAQISEAKRELETQAGTDQLTGLANRRRFDAALFHEWRRGARDATPVGLLMVDVDFFKRYNDEYGHQAGDECLKWIARAIQSAVRRPGDTVARYGGEEFTVVLPNTDSDGAAHLGEEVRAAVAALDMPHAGNPYEHVTVSVGSAVILPAGGVAPESLVGLADTALYKAKRSGRNRVCLYRPERPWTGLPAVARHPERPV